MTLFRKEAVEQQTQHLTGNVSLAQPLSIGITVSTLVTVATLIITFLFSAQYSRKEMVRGFLMPNKGVIKSYARQGGLIETLHVNDGDTVEKGQILVTLTIGQRSQSISGQSTELSEQLSIQLNEQITLLNEEVLQHLALQKKELVNLQQREQALAQEKTAIIEQQHFLNEKLALLNDQQVHYNNLHEQGYLSTLDNQRQQQVLLDVKQEKQTLARLLLQQQNEQAQIRFNQQNIPEQYQLRINALKRQQSDIENQLSQVRSNHRYSITAANAGVITGIQVNMGESVTANYPLLYIIPKDSELVAELLLPTRSAGFVQEGDNARLRFDAFPYQRFGFINSQISKIDQALIIPNEIKLPVQLQEPVYRLRAKINQQQINAYGKAFNLKSGMLFEADIMLEQRTLIQWLLEPIYSLRGRIS